MIIPVFNLITILLYILIVLIIFTVQLPFIPSVTYIYDINCD